MKYIKSNSTILMFTLIMGVGLCACNADKEDDITLKTLAQYKSELAELVSSEKVIVQNCVVGYNKGDFKAELDYLDFTYNYMAALLAAEEVLARPDLTIADVMAANYTLTVPGKYFNDNIWRSDRRPLHELIVYCDTLRAHTPEGTEVGQCPPEPRNQFIGAISAAKSVRGRSSTIDRQVTEAVDELNLELEIFEDAIIK